MPTEVSFRGGLNSGVIPQGSGVSDFLTVPPGQCLTFQDMHLEYGALRVRQPHAVLNSGSLTTSRKQTVRGWSDSSGGPPYLYAISSNGTNKMYRSSAAWTDADLTVPISYNDVTGSISPGSLPLTSDVLNGILIFTSQSVNPFKFTSNSSNAAALGGSPPGNAAVIKVVNNYAFLAGFPTSGAYYRVYWSAIGDPETWPAANFIDFGYGDGDPILSLSSINTNLIIFKTRRIGSLSTNSIFIGNVTTLGPFSVVFNNIGIFNTFCVDNIEDGRCVFVGTDMDVYLTDGYTLQPIANLAPPNANVRNSLIVARLVGGSSMQLKYAPATREIVVSSPFNPFILVFDTIQNYWRKITGITCFGLGVAYIPPGFSNTSGDQILLGSDVNGNIIALQDQTTFFNTTLTDENGTTIVAEASVSLIYPQNISEAGIYGVSVLATASGGTLYIGYDKIYSSTTYPIGSSKHRYDVTNLGVSLSNNQRPATMQIKLTSSTTTDIFEHVYIDMELED